MSMTSLDPSGHGPGGLEPARGPRPPGDLPPDAGTRELATALRASDPMRGAFDVAVRRFVRLQRDAGFDLDAILLTLASVLRAHVEPTLPTGHARALRDAVTWFAVSEYHRAD
jgi:hypothetical protein